MIPCQRELFDIPDDIAYLNCAYTAPLLRIAAEAGHAALKAKSNPWTITSNDFFTTIETARGLFARLIGSETDAVALIPAVSYGIALAANNVPVREGQEIIVLQDQFPSNIYSWMRLAQEQKANVHIVQRPPDSNWTSAVLAAINDHTAIVAVPNCHWTDGTLLDLVKIGAASRSAGAALVVDGIQSLGAMPFMVKDVQPDFLVAGSHKWLLGSYGFGFCYIDPKWHSGRPLEENWLNREGSEDFSRLVDYREGYQPGARRFDMGEASSFILSPVATAALDQVLAWGVENIAATLRVRTDDIALRAEQLGLSVAPPNARAPHLIGVSKPGGFGSDLPANLAKENVYVSVRGDAIRISPHLYNTDEDIDRLFGILEKMV